MLVQVSLAEDICKALIDLNEFDNVRFGKSRLSVGLENILLLTDNGSNVIELKLGNELKLGK